MTKPEQLGRDNNPAIPAYIMTRRLWNFLVYASLFLSIATAAFWGRGFFFNDMAGVHISEGSSIRCQSASGYLILRHFRSCFSPPNSGYVLKNWQAWSYPIQSRPWASFKRDVIEAERGHQFLGVLWFSHDRPNRDSGLGQCERAVFIPNFWLLMMTLIIPGTKVWQLNAARKRQNTGRCKFCDYDLCATLGRCPECGTIAAG